MYLHECYFLEENPFTLYFKQHNIIERDTYIMSKSGTKLIELCTMSDLNIVNGRIGKYKFCGAHVKLKWYRAQCIM